jgi:superfamily II helicase
VSTLHSEFEVSQPQPGTRRPGIERATSNNKHAERERKDKNRKLVELEKSFVPKEVEPVKKKAEVFTVDSSITEFAQLEISDKLKQVLKENGFEKLTNIQRQSIPNILGH